MESGLVLIIPVEYYIGCAIAHTKQNTSGVSSTQTSTSTTLYYYLDDVEIHLRKTRTENHLYHCPENCLKTLCLHSLNTHPRDRRRLQHTKEESVWLLL